MCAYTLTQVPDTHHTSSVTTDELALVRVNDYVVDRGSVDIVTLQTTGSGIPNLDRTIFRACHHPLALTVEGNTGNIVGVTLEGHDGIRIRGLNVKEFDIVMARSSKKALVGSNAQAVHLRVGVLNGARADSRESLPKARLALT